MIKILIFTSLLVGCGSDPEGQQCRDHNYMRLKCRTEMTGQYPLMTQKEIKEQCEFNYPEASCYYE